MDIRQTYGVGVCVGLLPGIDQTIAFWLFAIEHPVTITITGKAVR